MRLGYGITFLNRRPPMNTNFDYGRMASDPVRSAAYIRAIQSAIQPGDTVLDLGCGSGIFSVLAAKLGAKKVVAIDPSPAINFGPKLAEKNGVAHKIEFIRGASSDLVLPERVDCIFSDLRGALPLYRSHLATLKDASGRLLKPGGVLIPGEDWIYASPAHDAAVAEMLRIPWFENSLGLDLSSIGAVEANRTWRTRLRESDLSSAPKLWCKIRYNELNDYSFHHVLRWEFQRAGIMNGIALWFETILYNGIGFSNHPGKEEAIYGQTLLPTRRIEYFPGQSIEVALGAKYLRESYIWTWCVTVYALSGELLLEEERTTVAQSYLSPAVARL